MIYNIVDIMQYYDIVIVICIVHLVYRAMEKAKSKMESWKMGDQDNETNRVVAKKDELQAF